MTTDEKLDFLLSEMQSMKSNMSTKDDIAEITSKVDDLSKRTERIEIRLDNIEKQGQKTFEELIITEKWVDKVEVRVNSLNEKVDTLLLKADNTALLLKLINQQADELTSLKARLEVVEQKLA